MTVEVEGDYADALPRDESNLVAQSFRRLCEEAGKAPPAGLRIHCHVRVPLSSGLGSSSTAVAAGVLGANELLGRPFERDRLLELAADIEGHPDNVAAALLGGLTIVVRKGDALLTKKILVPEVNVALAVPGPGVQHRVGARGAAHRRSRCRTRSSTSGVSRSSWRRCAPATTSC